MQPKKGITRQTTFLDYEGFVKRASGEQPKTTDDCYTPEPVYDLIRDYAVNRFNLGGRRIVRPFWPGADYETFEYADGDVVIDNPPFSILSEILDFYLANSIDFFLFAPGLTASSSIRRGLSVVIIGDNIKYENGASIPTLFTTNLDKEHAIVVDGVLSKRLEDFQTKNKRSSTKIIMDPHIETAARLRRAASNGIVCAVPFCEAEGLFRDDVFGGGWILSDNATAAIAAAKEAAAAAVKILPLSTQEKAIINELNKHQKAGYDYSKI